MPGGVQLSAQVEHQIRVSGCREFRCRVIGLERFKHFCRVVNEVHHVGRVLAGMGAIQARQSLYRLYAGQPLVHIHAAQQRLVEAGLKLVRYQQDLILVALEGFADVAAFQVGIERGAVLGKAVRA